MRSFHERCCKCDNASSNKIMPFSGINLPRNPINGSSPLCFLENCFFSFSGGSVRYSSGLSPTCGNTKLFPWYSFGPISNRCPSWLPHTTSALRDNVYLLNAHFKKLSGNRGFLARLSQIKKLIFAFRHTMRDRNIVSSPINEYGSSSM